ncbi:hypothetical protein ACQ4PT_017888 [Festuca glaucescens]
MGGHTLNQTCDADDLAALRPFAGGLDGKGASPLWWGVDDGRSSYPWTGVSCDLGRVVGLDLSNHSLCGIAASLGRLDALSLSQNTLCWPVPLGLRVLDLSVNALSGAFLSSFASIFFPAIEVLNVSFNEFARAHPAFPALQT